MKTPLVSIIIPTYNRAHLIGETIDSIVSQSYTNWECIVVDDGSSDTTETIVQQYCEKESRIRFAHRPESHLAGGNGARNYGLELAKGDYIQWFDSDDLMHPEKLRIKIDMALETKADIIISGHSDNGDFSTHHVSKPEIWESATYFVDYILGKRPVITDDVMVKASIIGKRRFDEKLRKAQEYEFFGRLFQQELRYCAVDGNLVIHRVSENSISNSSRTGIRRSAVSLIYLSELLMERHRDNKMIIAHAQRQARKTYRVLVKNRMLFLVLSNFSFFRKAHYKNAIVFGFYILYNTITGKGFDRIKPKK